jgi:hypothetical protein
MKEEYTERTYIYNHTSPETAYVVDDYPWGFRLRTTIRYWVETKKAKNGGQRFAHQTVNPKTGQWCAPKYSTYSPIMVMFLDEKGHVHCTDLKMHDSEEAVEKFKERHLAYLDEFQREELKAIMAYTKVMKNVTFTCTPSKVGPVSLFSMKPEDVEKRKQMALEQEENKKRSEESFKRINRAIAYEMGQIDLNGEQS